MDAVVYLALFVLGAVFIVSFTVLIIMCRRRQFRLKNLRRDPRFSKLDDDNMEGQMVQLTPLLAMALERNGWVYDVGGLLQHCVAVLQLAHSLSEQLSKHSMAQSSPQLQHLVTEATHRIMPRFDDLLSSVASPKVDVRILEARATALATVCWSLALPFTLAHPNMKEKMGEPLLSMEQHLDALRLAAQLAEQSDSGKVDIDWKNLPSDSGISGNEEGESGEKIDGEKGKKKAEGQNGQQFEKKSTMTTMTTMAMTPIINETVTSIAETAPLLERLRETDAASPNGHPADPGHPIA
ncbi:unnamed protein product, partial [Mesorhabditis belari]|uniref:Transmembrane protein 98 n=1 Tax=Mesorhabditis belari TaxID=2138241 RepID=A0AAF3F454_9BILA